MSSNDSLEELTTKLNTYKEQLAQVQGLIASDPTNESFLKLQADLVEVVQLTEDLVNIRGQAGASSSAPPVAASSAPAGTHQIGSVVEAFFQDKWYPATLEKIAGDVHTVFFIGYGNSEELTSANIRPIPISANPVQKSAAVVGLQCEGQFSGDGKWYAVKIDEITQHGYKVTFEMDGTQEEAPLEYLRMPGPAKQVPKKNVPLSQQTGHLEIPEHLKIKPTDTEAEKAKKKKRIKAIKSHNRMNSFDTERKTKQQGWQGFQKKLGKKRMSGSISGMAKKKSSIFASPATVDGKVGVVGSGHGMTDFETRKKYKLNM